MIQQINAVQATFYRSALALLLALMMISAHADEIDFRLLAGIGNVNTDYSLPGQDEKGRHEAIQVLHYIYEGPWPHAWGLEIGRHRVFTSSVGDLDYTVIGIFVEARPYKHLMTQIGTLGYHGSGISDNNPFGLRAGIGTDYPLNDRFKLVGFVRQERIFDKEETTIISLELGIQFRIW